jgi:hypothetical protein
MAGNHPGLFFNTMRAWPYFRIFGIDFLKKSSSSLMYFVNYLLGDLIPGQLVGTRINIFFGPDPHIFAKELIARPVLIPFPSAQQHIRPADRTN